MAYTPRRPEEILQQPPSKMGIPPIASYTPLRTFRRSQEALLRLPVLISQPQPYICRCHNSRLFSSTSRQYRQNPEYKESFGTRLRKALGETKIKWYPIPVGLGIGFLGLVQFYRINEREKARIREEELEDDGYLRAVGSGVDGENRGRPKRRERIRPTGPWFASSFNGI